MKLSNVVIAWMTVILLAGCTTRPGSPPQRQNAQDMSASHGLVFVHFPRTMPNQFWIRSVSAPDDFYLLENNKDKSTAKLWLAPGEYQLYSVIFGKGGTLLEDYPSFTIEADKITSLGGLSDFNVGGNRVVWLPKSTEQTDTRLKKLQSRLGQLLTKIRINHWTVDSVPKAQEWIDRRSGPEVIPYLKKRGTGSTIGGATRQELLAVKNIDAFYAKATQALPPIANQLPGIDQNNNLYFGGEFGYIKKRAANGHWSNIKTNLEQHIAKVIWQDGMLLAAGKEGHLTLSLDAGISWTTIKTFDDVEKIYDIAVDKQNFMVLTTRPNKSKTDVMLYHGPFATNPQLTSEVVFTTDADDNAYPSGTLVGERYYIGMRAKSLGAGTDLFSAGTSYYFDNKTLKLHGSIIPRAYSFYNVAQNGSITAYFSKGMLSGLLFSSDGGKSWQDKTYPSVNTSNVIFNNKDQGTALSFRLAHNRSKSYKLHTYDGVEGSWKHLNDVPADCKYLLKDQNQSTRFCVTLSDKLLSLDDKGWKYERFQ